MTLKELIEYVINNGGTLDSKIILNYHCKDDDCYNFRKYLDCEDDWINIEDYDDKMRDTDNFNVTIYIHA